MYNDEKVVRFHATLAKTINNVKSTVVFVLVNKKERRDRNKYNSLGMNRQYRQQNLEDWTLHVMNRFK